MRPGYLSGYDGGDYSFGVYGMIGMRMSREQAAQLRTRTAYLKSKGGIEKVYNTIKKREKALEDIKTTSIGAPVNARQFETEIEIFKEDLKAFKAAYPGTGPHKKAVFMLGIRNIKGIPTQEINKAFANYPSILEKLIEEKQKRLLAAKIKKDVKAEVKEIKEPTHLKEQVAALKASQQKMIEAMQLQQQQLVEARKGFFSKLFSLIGL